MLLLLLLLLLLRLLRLSHGVAECASLGLVLSSEQAHAGLLLLLLLLRLLLLC